MPGRGPEPDSRLNTTRSGATTAMAGAYTVTITDANGCTGTPSTTVTVNPDLTIASQPANATICQKCNTVTMQHTKTRASQSYQWQYNNGTWNNVVNGVPTNTTYTGGDTASLFISGNISEHSDTDVSLLLQVSDPVFFLDGYLDYKC